MEECVERNTLGGKVRRAALSKVQRGIEASHLLAQMYQKVGTGSGYSRPSCSSAQVGEQHIEPFTVLPFTLAG